MLARLLKSNGQISSSFIPYSLYLHNAQSSHVNEVNGNRVVSTRVYSVLQCFAFMDEVLDLGALII